VRLSRRPCATGRRVEAALRAAALMPRAGRERAFSLEAREYSARSRPARNIKATARLRRAARRDGLEHPRYP
jgi:hypothetical protein